MRLADVVLSLLRLRPCVLEDDEAEQARAARIERVRANADTAAARARLIRREVRRRTGEHG